MKTKQGYMMNRRLRARIVELMAKGPVTIREVAEVVGVHSRTVRDYLTEALRAEIALASAEKLREPTVEDVDRAMMEQASTGNVAAARLIYGRLATKGEIEPVMSLEDIETEVKALRGRGHGGRTVKKAGKGGEPPAE